MYVFEFRSKLPDNETVDIHYVTMYKITSHNTQFRKWLTLDTIKLQTNKIQDPNLFNTLFNTTTDILK